MLHADIKKFIIKFMKPYEQAQKIPLVGLQDRRRKLTDIDKADIKLRYEKGEGIREIARQYADKCSRRSIQFVLFPDRLKSMQTKHAKEQHWKKYYNRKQLTEAVRNWRNYKYGLFKNTLTK